MFGHLLESKLQFYAPENFWKTFKLWGQPVNVREQQDAYDFFCNLTDQINEQLKVRDIAPFPDGTTGKPMCIMQKLGVPQVFQEVFGGAYLDQKLCRECDHKYDREESFLSVSLPVKSRSLQESLKEHVKGEMLEGENAYLCETCQEKVDCVYTHVLILTSYYHCVYYVLSPIIPMHCVCVCVCLVEGHT